MFTEARMACHHQAGDRVTYREGRNKTRTGRIESVNLPSDLHECGRFQVNAYPFDGDMVLRRHPRRDWLNAGWLVDRREATP